MLMDIEINDAQQDLENKDAIAGLQLQETMEYFHSRSPGMYYYFKQDFFNLLHHYREVIWQQQKARFSKSIMSKLRKVNGSPAANGASTDTDQDLDLVHDTASMSYSQVLTQQVSNEDLSLPADPGCYKIRQIDRISARKT